MKETIQTIKHFTSHKSDKSFAEFVGVTENTITRAKAGYKTKIDRVLQMLEHLILTASVAELQSFLEKFSQKPTS